MRILIYSINFAPELTGIGKYSGEMAEWLTECGHDVRVVTAPPYYPEWHVHDGYSAWCYKHEILSNLIIYRCPVWVPNRPSGLKRVLHLGSFALSSLPVILRHVFWRPDVIFLVEPTLMCAPSAILAARLCGASLWLHIQDLEVDAAFDLGILKSAKLRRIVTLAEQLLMRQFDCVSTISNKMYERLLAKGVEAKRATLFPNWVDIDHIFPLFECSSFRKDLEIPEEKLVILYSGNMGEKQGLDIVLEAAGLLAKNDKLLFVLCGEGAAKQRLINKYSGLKNVLWLGLQPIDQLNQLLNLADIHLLPQRPDAADLVMPSKLTGMFASGRPVVAMAHQGTEIDIVVRGCGIVVSSVDPAELALAISDLANDEAARRMYGANARAAAEQKMAKDVVLKKFADSLVGCSTIR
jgi:colanic acid biosynthesis glycosyl transferase WcaI